MSKPSAYFINVQFKFSRFFFVFTSSSLCHAAVSSHTDEQPRTRVSVAWLFFSWSLVPIKSSANLLPTRNDDGWRSESSVERLMGIINNLIGFTLISSVSYLEEFIWKFQTSVGNWCYLISERSYVLLEQFFSRKSE